MKGIIKYLIVLFLLGFYICCSSNTTNKNSSSKISDSTLIQKKAYKPGLGEYMLGLQMHHAKLWFAGINSNWKLADYEIGEMKELVDGAREFETERPEIKSLSVIYPALDSVSKTLKKEDIIAFKESFKLLTNTCNDCHHSNHFEFNVITIPTAPPVTNQDFKVQ